MSVQVCGHNQAGFGAGIANEAQHLFITDQWLGGPVFGDPGEQAVLDGIPFGGAGWVVSDCGGDSGRVAQLSLDFSLPGPGTAAVAATRVRQDEEFGRLPMATRSLALPPCGDGMGGKGWCVVRDADADRAAVIRRFVYAVGDACAAGVRAEVVIVHANRRAIPFDAGVFEVADQLPFLTVDADNGKALTPEARPQRGNNLKLLIPVWT